MRSNDRVGNESGCLDTLSRNTIDTTIASGDTGMEGLDIQAWLNSSQPEDHDLGVLERQWAKIFAKSSTYPIASPKSNLTVYELLVQSQEMTRVVALIKEQPELVAAFKDTERNHTIWAPTDVAFSRMTEKGKELSRDTLHYIIQLLITPHFMPIRRILVTPNVPVLLTPASLNGTQRLRLQPSSKGMSVNSSARIIAGNIFARNGVVHIIDAVVLPPPSLLEVMQSLPSAQFSMLHLAMTRTGLAEEFNDTSSITGCTVFAPSNEAFDKLGAKAIAFLFDNKGTSFLRALLKYHIAGNQTLYSNAFYDVFDPYTGPPSPSSSSDYYFSGADPPHAHRLIKGRRCFTLSTMLQELNLSVDIVRYGGLISMRVNDYASVMIQDILSNGGVVHVVNRILVPPAVFAAVDRQEGDIELQVKDLQTGLSSYC
ncbi:hypothetical protein MMC19_005320 [Ptychographa xylographoides]|nr:hypothetical protein [Ptychographa xylographoides]